MDPVADTRDATITGLMLLIILLLALFPSSGAKADELDAFALADFGFALFEEGGLAIEAVATRGAASSSFFKRMGSMGCLPFTGYSRFMVLIKDLFPIFASPIISTCTVAMYACSSRIRTSHSIAAKLRCTPVCLLMIMDTSCLHVGQAVVCSLSTHDSQMLSCWHGARTKREAGSFRERQITQRSFCSFGFAVCCCSCDGGGDNVCDLFSSEWETLTFVSETMQVMLSLSLMLVSAISICSSCTAA
mmetsp:Transcript_22081/g.38146  ORF Transcript_22081/g.38146 Transcript_22081/m.38146 type:complete len:247 (-) Transcript_22081:882-1622(-)